MGLSALEAVGWLLPGALFAARFAGDGRRLRGGPRWGRTGALAFGRMRLRPGNARFFCGAKSRSLMAAGMAGQGNGRALFPHAAFDGAFCIGCGRLAPSGGFCRAFRGGRERRSRGGSRWGGTGAGPLLGTGRVDVALGQDERWPLKGKRTCRVGAVWRRLRGVGRCRGVAQGYATRGVHGHEGTCRASGRDAARLVAGLGQACSAAYPQGRAQRWRSLPGKYRRTGYAARGHVRRSVSRLGGAAISVRGRSGLGQEGDFRAGAFRVWSGQRSPRRSVSRLGGTAIFTRGTFRAWAGGRFSRRNVLCPGGTAASARGRSGSGRDGDLCAGGVSCMGGTAASARGTFGAWAG